MVWFIYMRFKKINQKYKRKQLKNTIVPAKEIIGMTKRY